ncbi:MULTISPECIES: linear amide C-N hydrolase [Enterobacter]|uniref:linear amide C-N hydrolase n=1 Tax=Enterobacter TaxID=547 RepID=UPI0007ADD844|nr:MULTISPECIES: linear amide C-N hydrolase [Enterobacter]AMZ77784.1 hypothetical protein A4308_12565 [Enterobacter sp. ODB01]EKS6337617.1 linear amide C-N hydrolase [Enterobacter hormaechei]VAL43339.1 Penicillin acylase precursor [Enterobacter kobei]
MFRIFRSRSIVPRIVLAVLFFQITSYQGHACTRILWNSGKTGVLVGRTMDWPESTHPVLMVLPRGLNHTGDVPGAPHSVVHPVQWTSNYASLVTGIYGVGSVDGFNEKGLGAHLLYLNATEYPDQKSPGKEIQPGLWAQYVLDQAATVNEALHLLGQVHPVMITVRGFKAALHLVLEDANGDSAVVEYLNGRMTVHHNSKWTVVTNDPDYSTQLRLLGQHDLTHAGSDLPLPGNVTSIDRFTRAAYFSQLLKTPETSDLAIAKLLSVMRNVSVPYDAPYHGSGTYATEYRTIIDLTNKQYFFELTARPEIASVALKNFSIEKGSPVMSWDPYEKNGPAPNFKVMQNIPF